MRYYVIPPRMNPLSRFMAAVAAVLALSAVFFFGLAIFIILVAGFFIFALLFFLRSWWYRKSRGEVTVVKERPRTDGELIDGEYTVISRRRN